MFNGKRSDFEDHPGCRLEMTSVLVFGQSAACIMGERRDFGREPRDAVVLLEAVTLQVF